jgi:hypothetical protein
MHRGPKGEKRPTDVIGAAVMSYMSANCAYPPACRARPQGQGASEARQQARSEVACSGPRHKGDRKDYRSRGAARRTSPARAPSHQGPDRISRGPRRSAEGEEEVRREGQKGIADNEARIVNVGVRKNQLISDAQCEAVSEHLRPDLAQLVTAEERSIKSAGALA